VVPSVSALPLFAVTLALWGITQAALFPVSHVRVMKSAPQAPAFAAALNVSGANLGIGLGAIVGGRVIDAVGVGGVGYAAAALVGLSVVVGVVLMSAGQPAQVEAEPEPECAS